MHQLDAGTDGIGRSRRLLRLQARPHRLHGVVTTRASEREDDRRPRHIRTPLPGRHRHVCWLHHQVIVVSCYFLSLFVTRQGPANMRPL